MINLWKHKIQFYSRAQTRYDVQSPFIHQLVEQVLEDQREFYRLKEVQRLNQRLKKGSQEPGLSTRAGALLFRLAAWHKPTTIVEIDGRSGLGTAYLAAGRPSARTYIQMTEPDLTARLVATLSKLNLNEVSVKTNSFANWKAEWEKNDSSVELLYIHGESGLEPTLQYLDALKPFFCDRTVVVTTDMYQTSQRLAVWEALKQLNALQLTVDLLQCGLLFFEYPGRTKEHYRLVRYKYKPWRLGFFPRLPKH